MMPVAVGMCAAQAAGGLPPGPVRQALVQALRSGACGTFDVLARYVGWPEAQVSQTLRKLRHEGLADARAVGCTPGRRGRPRVVYGPPAASGCPFSGALDALNFASQVWR